MCFGLAGTAAAQTGGQYCEVQLEKCPDEYDGGELVVPLDVIAFSAGVQACEIKGETVVQGGDPPAIMFIIDHTNSMGTLNDTRGNRFRVTRALIDSVFNVFPNAEVGVVVFDAGLFLNSGRVSDPNLATFGGTPYYNPVTAVEQYMPLMQLNAPALGGGFYTGTNTPTAYEVYQRMFYVPTGAQGTAGIRDPNGTGNNPVFGNGRGTNVSIAFEAALEQFKKTGVAKENQYIIFISDGRYEMVAGTGGVPNGGCGGADGTAIAGDTIGGGSYGNSARCSKQRDFMEGSIGGQKIPTTYTVFLNTDSVTTMLRNRATLDTMTLAIKDNGYSNTNLSSNIWTADGNNYNGLMTLMMENIFSDMLSKSTGAPKRITISSSGGAADSAGTISDGYFKFRRQLPIDTAEITEVTMEIRYDVVIEVDTVLNGVTTTITRKVPDSLFTYSFTVRRTADAGATNWKEEQGLGSVCGDKPRLALLFRETILQDSESKTGPKEVKGNMDTLTIRFYNTNGLFDYDSVKVKVMNADGSFRDEENFVLVRSDDNIWEYKFPRAVAESAISGDGKLQHSLQDSIIVFFSNPDIPIDTLRVSVPFISTTMAYYNQKGDPEAAGAREYTENPVELTAGDTLDIWAKFFNSEGKWDESMEADPSKITWVLSDPNNSFLESNGVHGEFYSETAGRVYTVTATHNGLGISRTLNISVNPADPYYLEVVFDSTKIAIKVAPDSLEKPKEYEFGKDVKEKTFYVVERDRFGNLIIAPSPGDATWESNTKSIRADQFNSGRSALVSRQDNNFVDSLYLTVTKGGMKPAKVNITVVGESSVAIGPNPFVPNKSNVAARLQDKGVYEYYEAIVNPSGGVGGGHSVGVSNDGKGVLIAATAPRRIREKNGKPDATIVIYDAVGNVVFKSQPNDVALTADGNTFGFVWNGKNSKGRIVGPGTYLVRMAGTQSDGTKFSDQRKVGVTVEGKTR
jgi:hypothetical protein